MAIRLFVFIFICLVSSTAFCQGWMEPTPKIPIRTIAPRSGSSVKIPEMGAYRNIDKPKPKPKSKTTRYKSNYTSQYRIKYPGGYYKHTPRCSIHRTPYYVKFPPLTTGGVGYERR